MIHLINMSPRRILNITKPEHLILLSFLSIIIAGMSLLMMPFAATAGRMHPVDALFMAVSAVCVTGLSVVSVANDLTFWGQIIILVLVQIGGLGILTFSVLFFIMLGKQPSLRSKSSAAAFSYKIDTDSVRRILRFVILTALAIETVGALFLFSYFKDIHPTPLAVHSAIFHSICAFCNAGFSIYPDSLMGFNRSLGVPVIVMILIIVGGIGFAVVHELERRLRQKEAVKRHLSLHSKIALTGTAALILGGACLFWLMEANNTLQSMPLSAQIINSFFMSITPRTAGYNTIAIDQMTGASLFLTIILMFIGGCAGSTAGGVKVHTFIVLAALIRSKALGLRMTPVFNRKIPGNIIDKALAIFAAFFLITIASIFLLLCTETYWSGRTISPAPPEFFLQIIFEVVSAAGTVGLSTGITPELSPLGKIILSAVMFMGRTGPLTLMVALQTRARNKAEFSYPEEDVMVG